MKHLLSCAAVAGLLALVSPALAQTQTTAPNSARQGTSQPGADAQSGASTSGDRTSRMHKKSGMSHKGMQGAAMAHHRGGKSPEDNMAEELNRQELQRLQQGQPPAGNRG